MMGLEVFTPGAQELINGRYLIEDLKEYAPNAAILCGNLEGAEIKGMEEYRVFTINQKKILLTSIVDPALEKKAIHGIKASDPEIAIEKVLQVEHDLAVAVLHFSDNKARELLRRVKGIDIAILGTQRGTFREAEKINGCWVVKNNNHGKTIGCLDWDFNNGKPGRSELIKINKEDFAPDQKIANLVSDYEVWLRDHYVELEKSREKTAVVESVEVPYVGDQSCGPCHPTVSATWKKTRHARAYASLQAKCKDYCPDCLPCHVTGSQEHDKQGFISPSATPNLFNIQCEECHGPAKQHLLDPQKPYGLKIEASTCTICHTANTDPEFSFEEDLNLVSH